MHWNPVHIQTNVRVMLGRVMRPACFTHRAVEFLHMSDLHVLLLLFNKSDCPGIVLCKKWLNTMVVLTQFLLLWSVDLR